MKLIKSLKVAVVAAAVATGSIMSASAQDNTLLGAGSTFIYPLFSKIFADYAKTGVKVNYQSIGSGGGILQLTNKTVDFGDSDAPLNEEQAKKIGVPVLHIPMASGAVVITYNIPGVSSALKLNGKILADIYLGKVTTWNAAEIAADNRGVKLPDLPIVVVHRSDGSGTSFIFTDYLTKVNGEWEKRVGRATAVNWPVGLGGKGSEGVAGLVKQTPGAIGYVELAYAKQNHMPYASIQNKAGKFIEPTLASTTASSNVELPADSKVSLTNTTNAAGYPITSFTWAIIYKEQDYNGRSKERATQLVKLLWYNIHEGQKECAPLNYGSLSKSAVKVAEKILKEATYQGKAIL